MTILDHDSVLALIIGLTLANTQSDAVRFAIGKEFETAALNDFSNSFVEFEGRGRLAFHLDGQVTNLICKINKWIDVYVYQIAEMPNWEINKWKPVRSYRKSDSVSLAVAKDLEPK